MIEEVRNAPEVAGVDQALQAKMRSNQLDLEGRRCRLGREQRWQGIDDQLFQVLAGVAVGPSRGARLCLVLLGDHLFNP